MKPRRCAALCAVAPLLGACVYFHREDYPSRWPALAAGVVDCSSVAGTYTDSGERVGANAFEHDSLSAQLGALKSVPFGMRTERVSIAFGDGGAMDVQVSAAGRVVGTLRFLREDGDFECRAGSIVMNVRSGFSAVEQVAGWESETLSLATAADGSLILRRRQSAFGATGGVIPLLASGDLSWSRFPPSPAR